MTRLGSKKFWVNSSPIVANTYAREIHRLYPEPSEPLLVLGVTAAQFKDFAQVREVLEKAQDRGKTNMIKACFREIIRQWGPLHQASMTPAMMGREFVEFKALVDFLVTTDPARLDYLLLQGEVLESMGERVVSNSATISPLPLQPEGFFENAVVLFEITSVIHRKIHL